MNLQLLIDEEQTILMKNTLLVAEGDSETIGKVSNDINKHVDFLLCPSCFWCASYLNFSEMAIVKCPMCHDFSVMTGEFSLDVLHFKITLPSQEIKEDIKNSYYFKSAHYH